MKILIKVTKDVLQRSIFCGVGLNPKDTSKNCAIALAVREIFPRACVIYGEIYPDSENLNLSQIALPNEADRFINKFDKLKHDHLERLNLPEFSFEVDLPPSVVEMIGIEEAKEILKRSETLELVTN